MVHANPFIDITPSTLCSEINNVEESVDYKEKSSATFNGYLHISIERDYLGYRSKSFYSCNGDRVKGYTFIIYAPTPIVANELLQSWLPTTEYHLGTPSYNSYVSPYKERFERDIVDGLVDKNEVLVTWSKLGEIYAHLSVRKSKKHYEVTWSW